FVHEVDDQLELVQTLEVRDLGLVPRVDKRLEAGLDQSGSASAQHGLFTEQIRLRLLGERRPDRASTRAADRLRIRQRELPRLARRILFDGHQHRYSTALLELTPDEVSWPLWCDHADVDTRRRLDVAEPDVEPVSEEQRVAVHQVRFDRFFV